MMRKRFTAPLAQALTLSVLLVSTVASAQTTPAQKISQLEGNFGRELTRDGLFGFSLDEIGDFDGDGVIDLLVGMPATDSTAGAWVVLLNESGTVKGQILISLSEGTFEGTRSDPNDLFGRAVAGIGDLDKNGVTDIAIGAPADTPGTVRAPGAVYILLLNEDASVKQVSKILMRKVAGARSTYLALFGGAVAGPGDIDGDGIPDLVVGSPSEAEGTTGSVFILFMNSDGTFRESTEIAPGLANFDGNIPSDILLFGRSIASMGDFDGDGVPDIVVSAPGTASALAFFLFLNRDGTVKRHVALPVDGRGDLVPVLSNSSNGIDNLGDLNGDGVPDIVISDGLEGTFSRGIAWILFLNADGSVKAQQTLDPSDPIFGVTLSPEDNFGSSVAGIGDLNGDGIVDLAVGAPGDDDGGRDIGAVWILFSLPSIGSEVTLAEVNDLTGEAPIIGEDMQIQAEIFGIANVVSAEINFRRGGDPSFFSAPMTVEDDNIYSFDIPAFAVSERGVEYYITTTNAGGVDSRAPSSGVISIPVSLPNGLTASVPGGSSADQYGLISLPGRLENPAARDVFEDDLGPYDVSAWRLYSLGTRATLTELNTQPFDIEPGHSYWMLTAASNRVYNSGATISNRTDTLFPIRLEAGWNLVANPFSFPIPRTNLSTSSIQPIDLWSFAGTWRSNADTLLPFSGYAFFSAQTDILWVDPDLTPSNVDANRASTEHRTSNPNLAVQGVRRSQLEALFGTSAGNPPPTPSNHALDIDVYPNPFFGATTIGYELPSDERVTIRIFDVVGRLVVTLLDERQEAGFHSVTWGVSEGTISSGLYLVQVQAGDTVWSQPISRTK